GTSHVTEATRFALGSPLVGAATGGHRTRGQGSQLASQIPANASDRPGIVAFATLPRILLGTVAGAKLDHDRGLGKGRGEDPDLVSAGPLSEIVHLPRGDQFDGLVQRRPPK